MKHTLNKTRSSRDRYILIDEGMGGGGDPSHYPTHKYSVANGVNKGNGYQGYYSITYILKECEWFPRDARKELIKILWTGGFKQYCYEIGVSVTDK